MSAMVVHAVNVGAGRELRIGGRTRRTGIFKEPVAGRASVGPLGLAGDEVLDTVHHGGPDQAVYVYGLDDYAVFEELLGEPLAPGTFGENLTVAGFSSVQSRVGDRLAVGGEVVLEVTAPRIPCGTLGARMGARGFVARFREAGRPGVYCRVIAGGSIGAGDPVLLTPGPVAYPTVAELEAWFYADAVPVADLERALAAPIAERDRAELARRLAAAGDAPTSAS